MSSKIDAYDEDVILRVLNAYLYEGKSHRAIQKEILGLPAPERGGGFVAMSILHEYGIYGEHKGLLLNKDISSELSTASGVYREALSKTYEYKNITKIARRQIINQGHLTDITNTEISRQTKIRIYQSELRKAILENYNHECALCGINKDDLLFCSHIKPWAIDQENRLNPRNAICFCALHDNLFDRGYFSFDSEYKIIFSKKADSFIKSLFKDLKFKTPSKHQPNTAFLDYHFKEICS